MCNSCNTCGSRSCSSNSNSSGCNRRAWMQAAADAIPMRRYVAEQSTSSGCCCSCGGSSCGCSSCNSCGCDSCSSCGCGSCGCAGQADVTYYGFAAQETASGASLSFSRYSPAEDASPSTAAYLPGGRYLVSYSVNASAAQAVSSSTATLGIAPAINGVAFPRGGSFATVPADGSAALSSTFVATLPNAVNTLGFYNTGALTTSYQLLNIVVSRLG